MLVALRTLHLQVDLSYSIQKKEVYLHWMLTVLLPLLWKHIKNAIDTWRVLIQRYQNKENIQAPLSPTFLKTILNLYLRFFKVLVSNLKISYLPVTRNTLIKKFDLVLYTADIPVRVAVIYAGCEENKDGMCQDLASLHSRDKSVGRYDVLHFFGPWISETKAFWPQVNEGSVLYFKSVDVCFHFFFGF